MGFLVRNHGSGWKPGDPNPEEESAGPANGPKRRKVDNEVGVIPASVSAPAAIGERPAPVGNDGSRIFPSNTTSGLPSSSSFSPNKSIFGTGKKPPTAVVANPSPLRQVSTRT
jgi:hypothetical protein